MTTRDIPSHLVLALTTLLFQLPSAFAQTTNRGLASNDDIPTSRFGGNGSQVNWQYNWYSSTTNKQSFTEFVPMLWNNADSVTGNWLNNAWYWVNTGGSTHILGFNEPENPDQGDMTVAQAVAAYKKFFAPFIGHAQIGSPAVSNDGYDWLQQFLNQCTDCGIDFVAVHWYNPYNLVSDFQFWVTSICSLAAGKPVWITEFQGTGTPDQQSQFLSAVIPWLDNNACVQRYAYFGAADGYTDMLLDGGPELSALGSQYAFTPCGG